MKLYELNESLELLELSIDDYASEHEGEVPVGLDQEFEKLSGERTEKLLNLGAWIKSLVAEEKCYKEEVKSLAQKAKMASNKAERLKSLIKSNMKEDETLKGPRCSLSWRKSESVSIDPNVIDDILILPDKYHHHPDAVPNKAIIKLDLKADIDVPGCYLTTNYNLQVK